MSFWYRKGVCSNNRRQRRLEQIGLRRTSGAVLLCCGVGAVAYAQDAIPPGMVANFDWSQGFEYSDNPDQAVDGDSDFYGRTVLGFNLQSVRKVDRFVLDLNSDIQLGRDTRDTIDPTNYGGRVDYIRDTRNARAAFNLRYAEADANRGRLDEDFDQDGNVINQNEGTRQSFGFGFDGELGRQAPVGASLSWRYSEIRFRDTNNDPSFQDSSRNRINAAINFNITPRITASLTSLYEDFDSRGGVDRETTGFGSSVDLIVTSVDTANLALRYDEIERSGDQTGTDKGLSGVLGWTRALSNGSLGVNYSSDVSTNDDGRRSFFSVARRIELPRGGLSFRAGVTGSDTLGTDPLLEVNYSHRMPTSAFSFGLRQQVVTDRDNNEEINTRLNASFDQEINSLSSFGVSLSFLDRNELQDNANDGQRLDLSLIYRHDLTADWGLVSGFTHRFSTEDSGEDRRSNTIFVGLQRSFSWVP